MNTVIDALYGRTLAPIHWWQGASGTWHITSIYPLRVPDLAGSAVYIMAKPLPDGRRQAVYVGESADCYERMQEHSRTGKLITASLLGATELHVHLLAQTNAERLAVETDLRHGHTPLLNAQPVPYYRSTGLFGLLGRTGLK